MKQRKDRGSAILLVLVILVSIAILGASTMNISSFENMMAGNFKTHEIQFNLTEGTLNAALPLISETVSKNQVPTEVVSNGLLTSEEADNLFGQLTGFDSYNPAPDFTISYGKDPGDDIVMDADVDVAVDINRLGAKAMQGSALKFAQGGSGFNSGTAIVYSVDTLGTGTQSSKSEIEGVYLKTLGP